MLDRVLDIESVRKVTERARDKYDYETDKIASAMLNAASCGKDNVAVTINYGWADAVTYDIVEELRGAGYFVALSCEDGLTADLHIYWRKLPKRKRD